MSDPELLASRIDVGDPDPEKEILRFLRVPYLLAERVLKLARDNRDFHVLGVIIARQALRLVLLLNAEVAKDGPNRAQLNERVKLQDHIAELEAAMREWGSYSGRNRQDAVSERQQTRSLATSDRSQDKLEAIASQRSVTTPDFISREPASDYNAITNIGQVLHQQHVDQIKKQYDRFFPATSSREDNFNILLGCDKDLMALEAWQQLCGAGRIINPGGLFQTHSSGLEEPSDSEILVPSMKEAVERGQPDAQERSSMQGDEPIHGYAPPTVQITMVSDFACPWCYVAHKELHIALTKVRQTHPNTRFALEYRPYQLDPTLPGEKEKPLCRIACYKAKFGEEKMKKISAVLKERGKRVGIDFHMAGKTRQTTNAHRLALKAFLIGGEQAQTRVVNALFAAFFEQEGDIGCYDLLSNVAQTAGLMTADGAKAFLSTDELSDHVKCLIRHSVLQEVKGVPFTIVANRWAIQGAETADSFYRAFNFAANTAESHTLPINLAGLYGRPASNTLATPRGVAGNANAYKPNSATVESDSGSVVEETATTSGTSATTTTNPPQSTFSDGRTPVIV